MVLIDRKIYLKIRNKNLWKKLLLNKLFINHNRKCNNIYNKDRLRNLHKNSFKNNLINNNSMKNLHQYQEKYQINHQ